MKKLFFLVPLLLSMSAVFSQARTTTAEYNKVMQPAMEIELPFSEKTVMKSVVQKMENLGYKGKEVKDYIVFKGVNLPEIGPDTYDLYFKTDQKGKDKEASILTMLVSTGGEKFISESNFQPVMERSKSFLNGTSQQAVAYDLEQQIKNQEEALKKVDKKLAGLVEDGEDLGKKKVLLDTEIEENKKKQAEQKLETEKQVKILNTLKAKRKQ